MKYLRRKIQPSPLNPSQGLLSLGIYIYRRRLQSRKNDILRKVQYLGSPSKKDQDLSNSDTKSTFVVALPRSSKGTTGQNVTIGIGNDKPRVLYAMSGEDPSSAPLKRGGNGLHNAPTLKIDTSTLTTPPTQGHSLSPLPSPRTAASKSPGRFSMSPSMKSETLYKLVVVESTFPPSLTDELEIQLGEHLHLIEEYEDEWCLVQRIGSKEKGVIPRLCISEKDRSPSTKSRSVFRFSAQAIAASKASAI